jgi:hypothetical protein
MDQSALTWISNCDKQVLDYAEAVAKRVAVLEKQHAAAEGVVLKLYERITALEQSRDADTLGKYPITASTVLKSQAAQQQATEHLYAPLRTNTGPLIRLTALARRMLDPDDLGHAVTEEVRNLAREALGLPRVETKG